MSVLRSAVLLVVAVVGVQAAGKYCEECLRITLIISYSIFMY